MPTSPFSFAWVLPTEITFGSEHIREDEKIAALTFEHNEGDFGSMSIDIRNKRDGGFLQASRKQWAWIGYKGDPIFFGRLVGIPTDLVKNIVTLLFIARPLDYINRKTTLAATLRVPGYFDYLFIDKQKATDLDAVLEGYGALWSIDRVTHELGMSDYLLGEDGTVDFNPEDVPADSVTMNLSQAPLRRVTVDASFHWSQVATGVIDMGSRTFFSYTGASIISDWPQAGTSLDHGYTVDQSSAIDVWDIDKTENSDISWSTSNDQKEHANGDTMSQSGSQSVPIFGEHVKTQEAIIHFAQVVGVNDPYSDPPINIDAHDETTKMIVPMWRVDTTLKLRYDVARDRQEQVMFTLDANVQPIVTDPGLDDVIALSYTSEPLDGPIPFEALPIGDKARRAFLPTPRGQKALEYLIHLAEATLKLRARCVEISFTCSLERALELSTRMNARLFDDRLPGGQATGKVIKYGFSADGSAGSERGSVTIGCSIGYGNTIDPVDGTPVYVDEGYFNLHEVQKYTDTVTVLPAGNVGYTMPDTEPQDDGIDFLRQLEPSQLVIYDVVTGSAVLQEPLIQKAFLSDIAASDANADPNQSSELKKKVIELNKLGVVETLKANPVKWEFHLRPLDGGPFTTPYIVELTNLELPKTIDLEVSTAIGKVRTRDGSDVAAMAGTVS
jgi:hypothetical protein